MATLESLNELLEQAGRLLDQAAGEIRDLPLKPAGPNIQRLAQAMSELFELQAQIYALRPELTPIYMRGPSENPGGALNVVLKRVAFFEEAGEVETAIAFLEAFIRNEVSTTYVEQARSEVARLKRKQHGA
jgi:hypothetical protein